MIMSDIYLYFIDENIAKHKEWVLCSSLLSCWRDYDKEIKEGGICILVLGL